MKTKKSEMKKLIYFTVSHQKNYLNLLNLCIQSLYMSSNNQEEYDLLFITTEEFRVEILNKIEFKTSPLFLEAHSNDIYDSAFNKLKIFQYDKINEYEKIIYCDCDILWIDSPSKIFDCITENKVYIFEENEGYSINSQYFGGGLFTEEEAKHIESNRILGFNSGFFAFRSETINRIKDIHDYCLQEKHVLKSHDCIEQPLVNVFLYRNNMYSSLNPKYVGFNSKDSDECVIVHFIGGPGHYSPKIHKMSNFFTSAFSKS